MTKEKNSHKKTKKHVKPEDIEHLHSLIDADDEGEIEKEIKYVLKERHQKVHKQVALVHRR